MREKCLTLLVQKERDSNVFCPRCGVVVPPQSKCIPSPTRPEVHYHLNCMLALAQQLGRRVEWRDATATPARAAAAAAAPPPAPRVRPAAPALNRAPAGAEQAAPPLGASPMLRMNAVLALA